MTLVDDIRARWQTAYGERQRLEEQRHILNAQVAAIEQELLRLDGELRLALRVESDNGK